MGNGSVRNPARAYDNSDSALELTPLMQLEQFFAPDTWASDNATDRDMSTEPALLPDGQVLLAGKSRIAFLLDGAHLGGIGGQQAKLGPVCDEDIDGGMATAGSTVYLPCLSGIVAVSAAASPPGLRLLWSSRIGGGPPIVAGGLVWTISQDGRLYGIDAATGQTGRSRRLSGRRREPLPDAERRRRPAAGPVGKQGRCLPDRLRWRGGQPGRRERRKPRQSAGRGQPEQLRRPATRRHRRHRRGRPDPGRRGRLADLSPPPPGQQPAAVMIVAEGTRGKRGRAPVQGALG